MRVPLDSADDSALTWSLQSLISLLIGPRLIICTQLFSVSNRVPTMKCVESAQTQSRKALQASSRLQVDDGQHLRNAIR
jgi:hypothetical protein